MWQYRCTQRLIEDSEVPQTSAASLTPTAPARTNIAMINLQSSLY
nr:hypothetical protein [Streptomyces carminius]